MASQNWADESQAENDLSTLDAFPGSTVPTPLSNVKSPAPDTSRYPPDVDIANNEDFRRRYLDELSQTSRRPNGGKRSSGRPSSQRALQYMEEFPALSRSGSPQLSSHFDRYLLLQFDESVDLDQLNIFTLYDDITHCAGSPLRNIYRNNRHSYVLEASSSSQVQNLLPQTRIANFTVTISVFNALNQCKGVIKCPELQATSVDEIKELTADQGVSYVRRVKRWNKYKNELVDTHTYVFTFNLSSLPATVKVAYLYLPLELYIDNPRKCHQCQRYGHSKEKCKNRAVCYRCALFLTAKDHRTPCDRPPHCYHCTDSHPTSFRGCPEYKRQQYILNTAAREHVTFNEAVKRVRQSRIFSHKSFAAVAREAEAKQNRELASQQPSSDKHIATVNAEGQHDEQHSHSEHLTTYTIPKSRDQTVEHYSSPVVSPTRRQQASKHSYFSRATNSQLTHDSEYDMDSAPLQWESVSKPQQSSCEEQNSQTHLHVFSANSPQKTTVEIHAHMGTGAIQKRKAPSDAASSSPDAKRSYNSKAVDDRCANETDQTLYYDDFVAPVSQDSSLKNVFDSPDVSHSPLVDTAADVHQTSNILDLDFPPGYSKERVLEPQAPTDQNVVLSPSKTQVGLAKDSKTHRNKNPSESGRRALSDKKSSLPSASGNASDSANKVVSHSGQQNKSLLPKRLDPRLAVKGQKIHSIVNIRSTKPTK